MSLGNALLGLLSHGPMTGYDLKKLLDHPIGFFWVAQMSQIYRELNKMEEKGLVKSAIEPQEKRPDRKVYQLTKGGKETFLSCVTSGLVVPGCKSSNLTLKVTGLSSTYDNAGFVLYSSELHLISSVNVRVSNLTIFLPQI